MLGRSVRGASSRSVQRELAAMRAEPTAPPQWDEVAEWSWKRSLFDAAIHSWTSDETV
jgi:hypothetical protein